MKRDFLALSDLTHAEHQHLLTRAHDLKEARRLRQPIDTLRGLTVGLFFEKASTRTRVSFEAAAFQLGGSAVSLAAAESQVARGEPLEDTATVLSRYCDALVFRTSAHARLQTFARASRVPVINGLSDGGHPVQLLADLMTVVGRFGRLAGRKVVFVGDCASNMALSWIEAADLFDFQLTLCAPQGYRPPQDLLAGARHVLVVEDRLAAARGAEVVTTDVWTSMGQEATAAQRRADLAPFFVDESLMAETDPHAVVLHCLPAHRGEEITADVLDGPRSMVFDQAENRLHVQKALLEILLLGDQ